MFAMCAIDALGISAMGGLPVVIESADPSTGEQITVNVDQASSTWEPATAVVYVGRTSEDCAGPSASVCCGYINFFATGAAAAAWAASHPGITGGNPEPRPRPAVSHQHLRAAPGLLDRDS